MTEPKKSYDLGWSEDYKYALEEYARENCHNPNISLEQQVMCFLIIEKGKKDIPYKTYSNIPQYMSEAQIGSVVGSLPENLRDSRKIWPIITDIVREEFDDEDYELAFMPGYNENVLQMLYEPYIEELLFDTLTLLTKEEFSRFKEEYSRNLRREIDVYDDDY